MGFPWGRHSTAKSIYKTPEGEAEIRALYGEALAGLGLDHESLTLETRLGVAELLKGCRHVPSKAALNRVNERVLAFLAGPDGA